MKEFERELGVGGSDLESDEDERDTDPAFREAIIKTFESAAGLEERELDSDEDSWISIKSLPFLAMLQQLQCVHQISH
jgi:hypothetical protein